ncbi:hypothetical protein ABZU25_17435 [Micromonospora sp. NPDC005215]|uniref:hypothetical protein n=1 Tax=Micromonospora sp. NPDC005215 TaxID=3157024 RepID=UPI0033A64B8F
MTVEANPLHDDLIAWVREWNEGDDTVEFDVDTPLLANGVLDSMGLVAFISHLEKRTSTRFDYGTFVPGPSSTIRTLLRHCLR